MSNLIMAGGYLSGIFGSSPVRPMQQHMDKVHACVTELVPFVEASLKGDVEGMQKQRAIISRLEEEADQLKRELRRHLPNTLFMPMSRLDLLDVLTMQDRVANRAKDISGLMLGRKMQLPAAIADDYLAFVKRAVDACEQAQKAINELDELVETGFGRRAVDLVETMLDELAAIETDTDDMQIRIRATLFGMEKDLPPVDVMFYYRIIDWTGDLADRAERVGARLQLMLAR